MSVIDSMPRSVENGRPSDNGRRTRAGVGLTAPKRLGPTPMFGVHRPATVSAVDDPSLSRHPRPIADGSDFIRPDAGQILDALRGVAGDWLRRSTWRGAVSLALWCVSSYMVGLITVFGLVASIATSRIGGTGVAVRASLLRLLAELFNLDRRRIDALSGIRTPPLALPQPRVGAAPAELQQLWVQSPMRRRLPAFGLIRLPVVTAAAAMAVAWWCGTILGLELSIRRLELGLHRVHDYFNWRHKVDVLGVALRPWTMPWVEAVIVLVAALAGLVLWPRVQRALLSADAAFVRELTAWLDGTSTTELSREVVRLSETRAQAVTAADAERRRIERDLHDGFQPQLVNIALNLGLARSRLATDPEGASALLDRAHEDAKRATEDLRNIVRGIHPSVLDERGLDAAFSALAGSSRVRLQIDVHLDRRPPREAEGIAYFVVAEAVTNVNKHTNARIATVTVSEIEGSLRVLVQDDGEGGARSEPGGGLAGLADRIAAVDGTFTVTSPPGGPTWIEARIRCGS